MDITTAVTARLQVVHHHYSYLSYIPAGNLPKQGLACPTY